MMSTLIAYVNDNDDDDDVRNCIIRTDQHTNVYDDDGSDDNDHVRIVSENELATDYDG